MIKIPFSLLLLGLLAACVKGGSSPTVDPAPVINNGPTSNTSALGDDPLAPYAWHLENVGQKTFASNAGNAGEDMRIKFVHEDGITGTGVKIAVSDTGVEADHPDLKNNELAGQHRDYSSSNSASWAPGGNAFPIEYEAHGTAVAGLAAAVAGNGIGSRGVAPGAKFAGFLFLGDFHTTAASYEAKYLHQLSGNFDIFNYSYGYAGCAFFRTSSSVIDAFYSGVTTLRGNKGAIYVRSAGNDYWGYNSECPGGSSTIYFGNTNSSSEDQNHPYLVLVGALNARGQISSYSTPGSGLWVSAAGGEYGDTHPAMLTTDITGCQEGMSYSQSSVAGFNRGNAVLNPNCNYTSIMNGTSSAAPVLSGIIALMLQANSNLTWRDVKHILAKTATPLNFSLNSIVNHPNSNLIGHTYDRVWIRNSAGNSFSNTYGFGRVNAQAAVNMAKTYVSSLGTYRETIDPITGDFKYNSGVLDLPIPNNISTGVTHTMNVTENYVIESVQIKISVTHNYVGDLGVELTSPAGTTSKLLLIKSNISKNGLNDYMLITNAFYEESSLGAWTLKVIDGAPGNSGTLTNWKLKINGH